MHRQNEERIEKLVKGLAPYDFTKAEKLQIVNLAPTEPVELYVVGTFYVFPPSRLNLRIDPT